MISDIHIQESPNETTGDYGTREGIMFEKLVDNLMQWKKGYARPAFDPKDIGDPVAERTGWGPAKSGGASFRTHKLGIADSRRVEFMATSGLKLFCGVFFLLGLGVTTAFVIGLANGSASDQGVGGPVAFFPIAMGLLFAGIGVSMYYFMAAPIVFDKRSGWFWKGRKSPAGIIRTEEINKTCRLEEIHALQMLQEWVSSSKNTYYSYELNLVLNDGSRINVVDHGNQKALRKDVDRLSRFLGVPVWDVS